MPDPNDSLRMRFDGLEKLIEAKHDATRDAIAAQGKCLETRLDGIDEKLENHIESYRETRKALCLDIGTLQRESEQVKGAMKAVKIIHGIFASAIAALAVWLKVK